MKLRIIPIALIAVLSASLLPHVAEAASAKTKVYTVTMKKAHLPTAPKNGTDDYRCFLLDPKVTEDSIIRSIQFIPQRKNYVHHAIIFRVTDADIPEAIAAGRIVAKNGKLPIIVGVYRVDDNQRMAELAPEDILKNRPHMLENLGLIKKPDDLHFAANEYQDLLALRLVPELAMRYGLKIDPSRTAQIGASLGGLAVIYGVSRHPEVFGTALGLSTAWPLGYQELIDHLVAGLPKGVRVYADVGTEELDATYSKWHYNFVEAMDKAGWKRDLEYKAELYPGTGHKESWWGARVEHPINWWLNS